MADKKVGVALNLKRNAPSQYAGWNFNSMCTFNGVPIGANEDGIFSLDDAQKDYYGDETNQANITSFFELPTTDLGELSNKRFRKGYIGYETNGAIKLIITPDEDSTKAATITLTAGNTSLHEHRVRFPMSRSSKGVYWMFRIENMSGADYSVDLLELLPIVLHRAHG